MTEVTYLSVHALTKYIKRKFDADPHLSDAHIKGEISNFKRHSSGHFYFTLKDDKARILAVMFASNSKKLKFEPENGMMVLIKADVSVYEASGQYQLYVKDIQPEGVGALFLAYEQLKERLQQEGLFDPQRKRPIPSYPKTIGVVTSPTGAVIRDILTTIKRRYPIVKVKLFPAVVQGESAAASIVRAMEKASADPSIDVLIVGRGGGSIEELWPFNEEIVARSIVSFPVPVISAVGHETDVTIADFAADMRAPTPTAAAEIAAPNIEEVTERLLSKDMRLLRAMTEVVSVKRKQWQYLSQSIIFRKPERLYQQQMERLDHLNVQLNKMLMQKVGGSRERLSYIEKQLIRQHPKQLIEKQSLQLRQLDRSLHYTMKGLLNRKTSEFKGTISTLEALSPLKIMNRGYSLVYDGDNELIKDPSSLKKGDSIRVAMADKDLLCSVNDVKERE
ncbi:exodeoxyribonuclease VII large subunit [Jeotgalibacillus soli]|uniref:Exodeoxyribonuclease 7 large subunit n=1 Tax=Jeotgalibacillus soli TaxID=889306 RepID=A0A0C2RRH4_9BACL|nr:exodeoxyribonuclease VII large subunit [Jeotgalibacillus soli]KIL44354.1 exodeoxyribonuclease VII large subunit [Jeotgalibacillus soli]